MDNFNLRKYLAEGKLYEAINLDIEDDIAILSGDSGEYEGEIEDGKTSFSIIYDDLDYRISDQYNENNIEDFLGKGHAFVELAKKYDHKWGIERDLVGITIKLKDLAEGKLLKEAEYAADKFNVNVFGYQTKYYKVCPGAKAFMDKVVAGDYGDMNKDEAIRLAKLHDLLFMYEIKALKDSEYAANILDDAIYVVGVIKDQVQSMGMPIADVGYLDNHIEIIRDEAEEVNENINEAFDELDDGFDKELEFVIKGGIKLHPSRLKDVVYYIHNNWMAGNYGDDYAIRRISKFLNAK